MRVLLVGSGGREHALAWALAASPLCDELICAPGNAGIARHARCVDVGAEDLPGLLALAKNEKIDFAVIGPETALVMGIVDLFEENGIHTFGPSRAAAQLEGSKGFMKDFCQRHQIPTAAYGRFSHMEEALAFIEGKEPPIVIKTDGLAAGKGVIIAQSTSQAEQAIKDMMANKAFGEAGSQIVIEEFLKGEEASFFVLADGKTALPLTSAQDHKQVGEGDTGPNTGGMGAYSPAPVLSPQVQTQVMDEIIRPTIKGLSEDGMPYIGILFAGLMIEDGKARLLEFNIRFGDPECQPIMLRLKSDLLTAMVAGRDEGLKHLDLRWADDTALAVVMATKGYPGSYEKGSRIEGLGAAQEVDGVSVFHAGTLEKEGQILAVGGRVLAVTALGENARQAQKRAYQGVDKIDWKEGFCRRDIGYRAVARETRKDSTKT